MSLRALTEVWAHSRATGTLLLVELALADTANDAGYCWPGIDYVAQKSRMGRRTVIRLLQNLEDLGELYIERNAGPKGTNRYLLLLVSRGAIPAPVPPLAPVPDLHGANGTTELAPEPSGTVAPAKEPEPEAGPEMPEEPSQPGDFPDETEVMAFAAAYPGSPAIGIPAVMTKDWAQGHYDYHSFTVGWWAVNWKEDMKRRYERDWQNGHPRARGTIRQVSSGQLGGGNSKKTGAPRRERGEILQELALTRAAKGDTKELELELKGLP
jgi:hypothetical protein